MVGARCGVGSRQVARLTIIVEMRHIGRGYTTLEEVLALAARVHSEGGGQRRLPPNVPEHLARHVCEARGCCEVQSEAAVGGDGGLVEAVEGGGAGDGQVLLLRPAHGDPDQKRKVQRRQRRAAVDQ